MAVDIASIQYRHASLGDLPTLIDMRISFLKECQPRHLEREPEVREHIENFMKRSFQEGTLRIWIAEASGSIVGTGWLVVREQPGNFDVPWGRVGIVLNIYTVPAFRRRGISTSIMHRLIEEARGLQLDRLELRATEEGEPLYRKMGFKEPLDRALDLRLR